MLTRVVSCVGTSAVWQVSLVGCVFTALHGHLHARLFRQLGTHYDVRHTLFSVITPLIRTLFIISTPIRNSYSRP